MRAYYYDNLPGSPILPHESGPVDQTTLESMGVLYFQIPVDSEGKWEAEVQRIANERGYKNKDVVESGRELMGDGYEAAMTRVWKEHLHDDEEIRYPIAGSGYFDVRELPTDNWIRIHVDAGNLIVIPSGIYHRFSLDSNEYIKTMRLFKDEPKWAAHYRSPETDQSAVRTDYLKAFQQTATPVAVAG